VLVSPDAVIEMVNDSSLNVGTALSYVVLCLALHATLMSLVIGRLVGELAALSRYDVLTGLLVMLPGASAEQAHAVAERARAAVRDSELAHGATMIKLSISIGVAEWSTGEASHLLVRADAALYEAKHAGRDRVVLAR
jgi:PleD family two-component response regulator